MASRKQSAELPIVEFPDQAAWSAWLEVNHAQSDGVRLKFAKKGAPTTTVTFSEALETALCYGWIDGTINRLDEHFYSHRFTPRRSRSKWSQINCRNAEQLIAEGQMQSAGLAQVEAAKQDGRWDAAYEPQSRAAVPEDLRTALDENPKAKVFFETLKGANRYAVIYRINDAKRPETRAKRIASFVAMLADHKTLH